jgi:hypothetical protein
MAVSLPLNSSAVSRKISSGSGVGNALGRKQAAAYRSGGGCKTDLMPSRSVPVAIRAGFAL